MFCYLKTQWLDNIAQEYNIHAFNFEKFLGTSKTWYWSFLKFLAILVLVPYKPVSYKENVYQHR